MSGRRISGYGRRVPPESLTRLIVAVPNEEAERLDEWGIAAQMPSRASAIRFLLKKGLESVKAEENRRSAG